MDNVTTLLQTVACTIWLLKRFEELLAWGSMTIKPAKSCSLSIQKGARINCISFTMNRERMPSLAEQPIRNTWIIQS